MSRYALIWSFISWVALGCNKGILLFMGRFMVIRLVVSPGSGSGKIWVSAVLVTSEEFFPHIDSSYSTRSNGVQSKSYAFSHTVCSPCYFPLALYIFASPLPISEFIFLLHPPIRTPVSLPNASSILVVERVSAVVLPIHHTGGCWRRLTSSWLKRCHGDYTNESDVYT